MILQEIDTNTTIAWISDKEDTKDVLSAMKLLKKDGTPYKGVDVSNHQSYRFSNAAKSIPATKITRGSKSIYVCKDKQIVSISMQSTLDYSINMFGRDVEINYNDKRYSPRDLKLTLNVTGYKEANEFVTKLRVNSGQSVRPLVRKFGSICKSVGKASHKLIGYADARQYMDLLGPSKSGEIIYTDKLPFQITFTVIGFRDGRLVVVLEGVPMSGSKHRPYIITTTTPVTIMGTKFPSFSISDRGDTYFITPMVFDDVGMLKSLKGSLDLLK